MNNLDPQALECLAAIVEEGGFERAAQRLNITQSAVSQRLRALEAQAGTVLVVRSRPLRATSAGQLFIKHTKMLRLLRADLEREWRDIAPGHEGSGREDEACLWPSMPTVLPHGRCPHSIVWPVPAHLLKSSPTTKPLRKTGCAKGK